MNSYYVNKGTTWMLADIDKPRQKITESNGLSYFVLNQTRNKWKKNIKNKFEGLQERIHNKLEHAHAKMLENDDPYRYSSLRFGELPQDGNQNQTRRKLKQQNVELERRRLRLVKEEAKLSQILHIASMCEQKKIQFESSVDEFITHSAEEVKARIDQIAQITCWKRQRKGKSEENQSENRPSQKVNMQI